jgi:hypothetical protein
MRNPQWISDRQEPYAAAQHDRSAVRAFILLRQEASDAYAVIPQAAWEKWAAVIVAIRSHHGRHRN